MHYSNQPYDISGELVLMPYLDGIKLWKPEVLRRSLSQDAITKNTISQIHSLPYSLYFNNRDSVVVNLNEGSAKFNHLASIQDGVGITAYDLYHNEFAQHHLTIQKHAMDLGCMKIIEEDLGFLKYPIMKHTISIFYPWYHEDNVIGLFGCTVEVGHHSIAQAMSDLRDRGLLNYPGGKPTYCAFKEGYFSRREQDCIQLILKGMTSKQIGKALSLSYRTVEFYVQNLKKKLNVTTKAELIAKILA